MARTKQNQRSANRGSVPVGATGGRTPPSKTTVALLTTSVLAAIWAAAMLTPAGRIAYVYVFAYAEFYFGVLALVFLSITVMAGVLATDRMILTIRQRVLLQSAHRTTGIIAIASLVVHVTTKLAIGHVAVVDAFVPFLAANNTFYVGLGTTAAFFMVSVLWTGIARARFIGRGKPWMWRSMHSLAYLSWPIALVHGLSAGRAAKTWVLVSYIACIALVLITLLVRLSVAINRKKDFASSTSTGSIKPVGKVAPTASPAPKARLGRRAPEPVEVSVEPLSARVVADRGAGAEALRDRWGASPQPDTPDAVPAGRDRDAVPVGRDRDAVAVGRDRDAVAAGRERDEAGARPRRRAAAGAERRELREAYADEPRDPRYDGGRYDGERYEADRYETDRYEADRYDDDRYEAAPRRGRRRAGDDAPAAYDRYADAEPPRRRRAAAEEDERRRAVAEEDERRRAVAEEDQRAAAVKPRSRRYADEPVRPRARRAVDDERYEPPVRTRRTPEPAGARWRADDDERAPVPAPRAHRYADDDEPVRRRSRRYADDDRSGWRADDTDRYEVPQGRSRGWSDDDWSVQRANAGRHSRAEAPVGSTDRWSSDGDYLPPDDTPTLVDMASRRALRQESARGASRAARRRRAADDGAADDLYFRQLRGEAQ